jgi:hypothetical protein
MTDIQPMPPAPAAEAPPMNPFARMTGALFAPVSTFRDIARKPDFLIVLIVLMLLSAVSAVALSTRLDVAGSVRASMEERHMNPEQIDRAVKVAGIFSKMMLYLAAFLTPLVLAIVAGVMLLAFRIFRGEGTFKQAYAVTLYAWMPMLLLSILTTAIALTRHQIDPRSLATIVRSNPAFLVDMNKQPALFALLSSIDVFSFWTLTLMTLGYSAMARVSRLKASAIVISVWLVRVLFSVGLAALGAMQGHA